MLAADTGVEREVPYLTLPIVNNQRGVIHMAPEGGQRTEHTEVRRGGVCSQAVVCRESRATDSIYTSKQYAALRYRTKASPSLSLSLYSHSPASPLHRTHLHTTEYMWTGRGLTPYIIVQLRRETRQAATNKVISKLVFL